jgi:hypothetical protein
VVAAPAGLMVRESLDPLTIYVFASINETPKPTGPLVLHLANCLLPVSIVVQIYGVSLEYPRARRPPERLYLFLAPAPTPTPTPTPTPSTTTIQVTGNAVK